MTRCAKSTSRGTAWGGSHGSLRRRPFPCRLPSASSAGQTARCPSMCGRRRPPVPHRLSALHFQPAEQVTWLPVFQERPWRISFSSGEEGVKGPCFASKEEALAARQGFSFCMLYRNREPPALLGRVKSFSFKHRAKREESNNLAIVKKLILDKQRPFTGCGASDASGGFFSAS